MPATEITIGPCRSSMVGRRAVKTICAASFTRRTCWTDFGHCLGFAGIGRTPSLPIVWLLCGTRHGVCGCPSQSRGASGKCPTVARGTRRGARWIGSESASHERIGSSQRRPFGSSGMCTCRRSGASLPRAVASATVPNISMSFSRGSLRFCFQSPYTPR